MTSLNDGFKGYYNYFFVGLFALLAFLSYLLIRPFLMYIITALFLTYLFFPVYRQVKKIFRSSTLSSLVVVLVSSIIILLPLTFALNSIILEIMDFYNKLDITSISSSIASYLPGTWYSYFAEVVVKVVNVLASSVSVFLLSLPQKILGFLIILVIMFFGFRGGEDLVSNFKKVLPLKTVHKEKIFRKISSTMHGVVYGTIVISLLQGFFAALGFYLFGIPDPFLWGLIVTVVAMLPIVGPNTVIIPLVVYLGFSSGWVRAISLLVYSLVILTFLMDVLLKTKLTSKKAKVHPLVAFLGVIGGIAVFGLPGLFLGPIILALFLLLMHFYVNKAV